MNILNIADILIYSGTTLKETLMYMIILFDMQFIYRYHIDDMATQGN